MKSPSVFADDTAPPTPKKPVTNTYHGVKVVDDYRWLEDGNGPGVRAWTEAQNQHTRAALDRFPARAPLVKRIRELVADPSSRFGGLRKAGGTLFAMKFQPPKEQPFLVTLASADDPDSAKVVLDPTALDPKAKTAIDFYVPSPDGKLVAVSLSQNGTEDGTVHVYEVATGKQLADVVPRVNYPTAGGDLAWAADGGGFFYTRYPRGRERPKDDLNFYQQVYFHKLGTTTEEDRYEIGKEFPRIAETQLEASADGRYLLAVVLNGDGGEVEHHLRGPDGKWSRLTRFEDRCSGATFGVGDDRALYVLSRQGEPHGRILRLPLDAPELAKAETVVPAGPVAIEGLAYVGNRWTTTFVPTPGGLFVVDMDGGPSRLRFVPKKGEPTVVPLPPASAVRGVVSVGGNEILTHVEGFTTPAAWYSYKAGDAKPRVTALRRTPPADLSDIEVSREFATSKDGTKVPVTVLSRKGTKRDGANPTLLTGYGGFGINISPSFQGSRRVWFDQGGVLAIANLRGGAEFGEEWHTAGQLTKKQNVFDDFAACARHLIERKYTSPTKLAIEGGSNGGLLVGAALTQHPELFRAVVAHVGLYDMLRFEQHPNGVFNVTEYGTVQDLEQFKALRAYSPYQNVRDGEKYPAVYIRAGANDGRVDAGQSRKFAARLQAATASGRPVLLHIDFGSGHGIGDNLSDTINRAADVYAFLFTQLGVTYQTTSE